MARLCRLLSLGKPGRQGRVHLDLADLAAHGEGLIAILIPDKADEVCAPSS
jgi:error-prone DNA polymerase